MTYHAPAHLFFDYFLLQKVEPLPAAQAKVHVHSHACDLSSILLEKLRPALNPLLWMNLFLCELVRVLLVIALQGMKMIM